MIEVLDRESASPFIGVSQLRDIQPGDWQYEALRSLIERYGGISGYPNGTFRGDRPLTRAEFAAALSAILERVRQLQQESATSVSPADLETLQGLVAQFPTEIAILRGRTDALTARITELELTQFSTTAKLRGQSIIALNGGGFDGEAIAAPTGEIIAKSSPDTAVLFRASLDFDVSFTGEDLLKIRVDTGSNGVEDNVAGILEPNFGSALDISDSPPSDENFGVGRVYYRFRPGENLSLILGPVLDPTDFLDNNRYAALSFRDFSTENLVFNPLIFPIEGVNPGAIATWNPRGGAFEFRAQYISAGGSVPGEGEPILGVSSLGQLFYPEPGGDPGLFGDSRQGSLEVEYEPKAGIALRLLYSGGEIFDNRFDAIAANVEWAFSPQIAVFGRYGYGFYQDTRFGDIEPNYWMAGVSLRDVGVEGAIAGVAVSQPVIATEIGDATQTNFEAFYNFPVNENIRISPIIQAIADPGNQSDNGTIITGTLRTTFIF